MWAILSSRPTHIGQLFQNLSPSLPPARGGKIGDGVIHDHRQSAPSPFPWHTSYANSRGIQLLDFQPEIRAQGLAYLLHGEMAHEGVDPGHVLVAHAGQTQYSRLQLGPKQ